MRLWLSETRPGSGSATGSKPRGDAASGRHAPSPRGSSGGVAGVFRNDATLMGVVASGSSKGFGGGAAGFQGCFAAAGGGAAGAGDEKTSLKSREPTSSPEGTASTGLMTSSAGAAAP